MLVGRTKDSKLNYYTSSEQQGYRTVAKWYRILSVDDEMSGSDNKTRWITVTGPEWRTPAVLGSPQPGEMENTQGRHCRQRDWGVYRDDDGGTINRTKTIDNTLV